jgi:hypothetical protein
MVEIREILARGFCWANWVMYTHGCHSTSIDLLFTKNYLQLHYRWLRQFYSMLRTP